jgi:hypothetical protein
VRLDHCVHHLDPVLLLCHVEVEVAVAVVVVLGAQGRRGALAQVVADVGQHHLGAPSRTHRGAAAPPKPISRL